MIELETNVRLKEEIKNAILLDKNLLVELRNDVRPLKAKTYRIQSRSTTAIAFVGTDGGHNQLQFDPFLMQLVRVVDSSNNEYSLEVVTPSTSVHALSMSQFNPDGSPRTPLGELMAYLGVRKLNHLSPMIKPNEDGKPTSPSWIGVYRELVEWAVLFKLVREKDYGSDTLILFDGFLRSKVFGGELFVRYRQGLAEGIERQRARRRKIYIAGIAKKSKVLDRYRLAMKLETALTNNYPCYVEVPRLLEQKTYVWDEYARGDDVRYEGEEKNKFVAGKMFFVKFGNRASDPIWAIDILTSQTAEASTIMGYLLADAQIGFPVPFYPSCLQRAHENAALVDFDMDMIQEHVFAGIRYVLADEAAVLDEFRLEEYNPSSRRYR